MGNQENIEELYRYQKLDVKISEKIYFW